MILTCSVCIINTLSIECHALANKSANYFKCYKYGYCKFINLPTEDCRLSTIFYFNNKTFPYLRCLAIGEHVKL